MEHNKVLGIFSGVTHAQTLGNQLPSRSLDQKTHLQNPTNSASSPFRDVSVSPLCTVVVQLPSCVQRFETPWTAAQRLLCPSPYPRVCSDSCPLIWWCHSAISSSVAPSSSCFQSFPASGALPVSQLFAWDGQSLRASASASVLPINIQGWFPLESTGLNFLLFNLKSLLRHHSSKASVLRHSAFFMVQLSHVYMATRKTVALTRWTLVSKVIDVSAFEYV